MKTWRAKLLNVIILVCLSLATFVIVGNLVGGKTPATTLLIDFIMLATLFVLRSILYRGKVVLTGVLLIVVFVILVTGVIATLGTIRTPTTQVFILAVVIAAQLFGKKGLILSTIATSLMVLAAIMAENAGLLPSPDYSVNITQWVTNTATFALTGILSYFAYQSSQKALVENRERKEAEAKRDTTLSELKKSEENLRSFMENARDFGVYSSEVDDTQSYNARFSFASPSVEKILGIEKPTEKADLFRYIHPDDLERVERANQVSSEYGSPFNQVFRSYHVKKEMWRWFHLMSSAVKKDNGGLSHFNGLILDVTEQKQIEVALRESEEKYRTLIEQSNDVIYLLYENHFEMVNQKFEEIFGVSSDEARTTDFDFMTLVAPQSYSLIQERVQKTALGREVPLHFEFTALDKNGKEFEMEASVSYISYKKGIAIQGILRDITEERKIKEALEKSEMKFRSLVESSSDWIWEVDRDGIYTYVSPQIERILGYTADEVLGKSVFALMPSKESDRVERIFNKILGDGGNINALENINIHKSGEEVTLETNAVPFFDKTGKVLGYRGVDRDITKRKKAQKDLEEINHALEYHLNEIKELQEELRYQALRDPLTGLFNRRYMEEALGQEFAKAKRRKMPLSIVVLDLDNLKEINDKNGHFTGGDEALKTLANVLTKLCRAEDTISRYGGDEFLVLLYDTSAEVAYRRALEWRAYLTQKEINVQGKKISITFSAGVASFPDSGSTTEEVLVNADKALYGAKKNGRDKVIIYNGAR